VGPVTAAVVGAEGRVAPEVCPRAVVSVAAVSDGAVVFSGTVVFPAAVFPQAVKVTMKVKTSINAVNFLKILFKKQQPIWLLFP
jgi:hypothetical protein